MNVIKNKKAQDLKNKIQTQIAKYNSQLNAKKSFRQTQVLSLKKKYNAKAGDLTQQFENVVTADVYIAAVTDIINNLKILFQNPELLVDGKKLPSDIQVALEYCHAVGKVDKQPDLHNLIKGIIDKHKALTDISITHETYVYFGTEQITHEDVEKYFPQIKHECNFVEDQYLVGALSKYSDLIQVPVQNNNQFMNPQMQQFYQQQAQLQQQQFYQNLQQTNQFATQNLQQTNQFATQNLQQTNQFATQNLQQTNQFATQNLPQVPQFTPQNLSQPPQFTPQNLQQPPQFTPQNVNQPPQFSPQGSVQQHPQFATQNIQQPPQFTPQNLPQPPQFTTQNLQQPPQFTPPNQTQNNLYQSPYSSSDSQQQITSQTLPQPPQNATQNFTQFTQDTTSAADDSYQPPQVSTPPPFAPPPFSPTQAAPPQLSEVAGNMAYPQVPTMFNNQNGEGN